MGRYHLNFGRIAEFLLIAAALLLGLRTKEFMPVPFFHLADIMIILAVISASLSREFRDFGRRHFGVFAPYLKLLSGVVVLIVIGQLLSYLRFGANPLAHSVVMDYLRLIINLCVFFLTSFIIYKNSRILRWVSMAIVASLALVVPVYFYASKMIYFSASRLSGLMENSIVFGAWVVVALILCIGFIVESREVWKRVVLSIWLAFLASFFWWSGARTAWLSMALALALIFVVFLRQREWAKLKLFLFVVFFAFIAGYFLIGNNNFYNVPRHQMQLYLKSRVTEIVTSPTPYYESRLNFWNENMAEISRFPFGFGFTDSAVKNRYPGFVSIFFEVIVYGGVFALVAFIFLWSKLIRAAAKQIKSALREKSDYLKISWLVIGVALLVNIISFNFFLVRIFWFALGVVVGIILRGTTELVPRIVSSSVGVGKDQADSSKIPPSP